MQRFQELCKGLDQWLTGGQFNL